MKISLVLVLLSHLVSLVMSAVGSAGKAEENKVGALGGGGAGPEQVEINIAGELEDEEKPSSPPNHVNADLEVMHPPLNPALHSLDRQKSSPKSPASRFAAQRKAFVESFLVIVVSEIGDRTFFIAAILAMTHSRFTIFSAASSALVIMTVLSAAMGYALPNLLRRELTQFLAALLFLFFGVKLIREAMQMDGSEAKKELEEVEVELSLRSSSTSNNQADGDVENGRHTPTATAVTSAGGIQQSIMNLAQFMFSPVFIQAFVMTFLAEWGDRSQIATIALAAAEDVYFVTIGASLAHMLCTCAAVVGGRLLATRISPKTVTLTGAVLFLLFGATSLFLSVG